MNRNEHLLRWSQKMLNSMYIEFPHKRLKNIIPKQEGMQTSMYYRELKEYCVLVDNTNGRDHGIDVLLQQCLHYLDSDAPDNILRRQYNQLVSDIDEFIKQIDNYTSNPSMS